MNGASSPYWPTFPPRTLRQLFDAVDTDDVVDAHVTLPEPIVLACPGDTMRRCYALCLQFWEEGVHRRELLVLVGKLLRYEGLNADERLSYKYIRARYKHLRFAQRLYSRKHRAGYLLTRITRSLGHLNDAYRSGQRKLIVQHGWKLRLLLSKPVWALVVRHMRHLQLDDEAGLLAYQRSQMRYLKALLELESFVGDEFHRVRKLVSMQVSYYDTVRSLARDEHARKMSRFLAAINGLMGARHDEMVAEALGGRRAYETPATLARDIRTRLETLLARYPF